MDLGDDRMAKWDTILIALLAFAVAVSSSGAIDPEATIVVPDDVGSITKAIDMATRDDVILIRKGVYVESLLVNKGIRIVGEPGTILLGRVTIIGASDVVIKGLSVEIYPHGTEIGIAVVNSFDVMIENVSLIGTGIQLHNSSNVVIKNCSIVESPGPAIRISGSSRNITIERNFLNNTYVGLFVVQGSDITFRFNTVKSRWLCVDLRQGSHNIIIYLNNLDGCRVRDLGGGNYWYDPRTRRGNYWGNHTHVDNDLDGILDEAVSFEGNIDPYPLANPFYNYINGFTGERDSRDALVLKVVLIIATSMFIPLLFMTIKRR